MPSIHQRQFAGEHPAVIPQLLDPRYAVRAHNVILRDGSLRALPEDDLMSSASARTILKVNDSQTCCGPLQTWVDCVWPLVNQPAPNTCHEFDQVVVFPTRCAFPPYRWLPCTNEMAPLVMPAPTRALTLTRTTEGTLQNHPYAGPDARSYTYTWIDKFGVESPPAMPSVTVRSYDDECWRLSNFDTPPAHAVAVRIYRVTSALETGEQIAIVPGSSYQLVDQMSLSVFPGYYGDCRKLKELDYGTLLTDEDCPPPCMEQVMATQSGYAVGWSGNDLYFSERYEPWNWPTKYRTTLPHRIVGIAVTGDFVFVGTTGQPFRVNTAPAMPANQTAQVDLTIDPLPYDENFPCLGRFTLVSTNFGAMYVSRRGLVALQPRGAAQLLGRERIDEEEWMSRAPNLAAWVDGKYLGVRAPAGDAMLFDVQDNAEGKLDLGDLVTFDLPAAALHMGRDGFLYYGAIDGGVYRFATGGTYRTYTYRSRVHRLPGILTMTAVKVVGDYGGPVEVELYADGLLAWSGSAVNSKAFRIPPVKGIEFQFLLRGATRVREVHIGTGIFSMTEDVAKG
jgi:hypothetical protein